jgi:hypothetical protein
MAVTTLLPDDSAVSEGTRAAAEVIAAVCRNFLLVNGVFM